MISTAANNRFGLDATARILAKLPEVTARLVATHFLFRRGSMAIRSNVIVGCENRETSARHYSSEGDAPRPAGRHRARTARPKRFADEMIRILTQKVAARVGNPRDGSDGTRPVADLNSVG
jgi:hypothetical protein